jgi:hypothetical protein
LTPAQQASVLTNVYSRMQIDPALVDLNRSLPRSTTIDRSSEGYEVELNYNPNRYFSLKLTGSRSESVIDAIAPTWQNWVNERMPVWTTVTSPFNGSLWWTSVLTGGITNASQFQQINEQPMKVLLAQQGLPVAEQSKYKATLLPRYRLAHIFSIGFYGKDPEWTGFYLPANPAAGIPANTVKEMRVLSFDVNKPIWFKDQTYVNAFVTYDFRLFSGRVKSSLQLNVNNLTESGRLQPYAARPDGTFTRYRIIDPREYSLTLSFDL